MPLYNHKCGCNNNNQKNQKQVTASVKVRYREIETVMYLGGNVKWFNNFRKQFGSSSKDRVMILPHNSTSRYIIKGNKNTPHNKKYTLVSTIMATVFRIFRKWKQPSANEWINNLRSIIRQNIILP